MNITGGLPLVQSAIQAGVESAQASLQAAVDDVTGVRAEITNVVEPPLGTDFIDSARLMVNAANNIGTALHEAAGSVEDAVGQWDATANAVADVFDMYGDSKAAPWVDAANTVTSRKDDLVNQYVTVPADTVTTALTGAIDSAVSVVDDANFNLVGDLVAGAGDRIGSAFDTIGDAVHPNATAPAFMHSLLDPVADMISAVGSTFSGLGSAFAATMAAFWQDFFIDEIKSDVTAMVNSYVALATQLFSPWTTVATGLTTVGDQAKEWSVPKQIGGIIRDDVTDLDDTLEQKASDLVDEGEDLRDQIADATADIAPAILDPLEAFVDDPAGWIYTQAWNYVNDFVDSAAPGA